MKKTLGVLALFGIVLMTAPAAMGACSPAKTFSGWDVPAYVYNYVYLAPNSDNNFVGAFWQAGDFGAGNSGTYPVGEWLRYYAGTSQWYVSGNMGDGRVAGCPANVNITVITDTNGGEASYAVQRTDETPPATHAYRLSGMNLTTIPRPKAIGSAFAGTDLILQLQFDDSAGAYGSDNSSEAADVTVTGLNLYRFEGAADPGRDVAAWTQFDTIPWRAGTIDVPDYTFDCSNPVRTWIAAGIQFDGGSYSSEVVGAATAVECDQTIADPDRYKVVRPGGEQPRRGTEIRRR